MVVISSSLKKAVTSTDLTLNLLIENIHIKRKQVTKFLGVLIDKNLFWKQ